MHLQLRFLLPTLSTFDTQTHYWMAPNPIDCVWCTCAIVQLVRFHCVLPISKGNYIINRMWRNTSLSMCEPTQNRVISELEMHLHCTLIEISNFSFSSCRISCARKRAWTCCYCFVCFTIYTHTSLGFWETSVVGSDIDGSFSKPLTSWLCKLKRHLWSSLIDSLRILIYSDANKTHRSEF